MKGNETEFFDSIRQAIASGVDKNNARPPYNSPQKRPSSSLLRLISHRSPDEQQKLVEKFEENAGPLNVKTTVVESLKEAEETVVELIRSKKPEFSHNKHVMLHDHPDLAAMKLWKKFNRESVTVHSSFSSDTQVRDKTVASFIGVTAPDIAIAESATLVEISKAERPRSTSLVPSIHLAIIKRENLVSTLEEAYALLKKRSPLEDIIFISGPSKTADIEAQLVFGAHGPKELHVILISPTEYDIPSQQE